MEKKFLIGPSPHIRTKETVDRVMLDVIIAMIPMIIGSIIFFREKAVIVLLVSILSAVISEAVCQILMKKDVEISDFSAVITGILFAFVVPPTLPIWITAIGASVSIVLGKMIFGGLGHNIFNPALVGRVFIFAAWPAAMSNWINVDMKAGATVLDVLKQNDMTKVIEMFGSTKAMYLDLFLGKIGGCVGETSALLILIGGIYLLIRKQITWHIPFTYIGTVFILTFVFGQDPLFHILSGGLFLGAFFMATDMVTTPYTSKGKIIFGIGAGMLVVLIRLKGSYPEGTAYSILLMNALTPIINKYTKKKIFGEVKKSEQ